MTRTTAGDDRPGGSTPDGAATHAAPPVRPFRLRAVLFDFDGTLTLPGALDFEALKREVGCPPDRYVLEWIRSLADGPQRQAALAALERSELEGARASAPNQGAQDLVRRLRARGLALGVLTRNGRAAVERAMERFTSLSSADFDVVVTRDDAVRPKPAADGVEHAALAMGAVPAETLVVGDFLLDMEAGRAAGAVTAYLTNGGSPREGVGCRHGDLCDFVVHSLDELEGVVELGLAMGMGKLPNDLLARHLARLARDPAVLIPAGVGEDVAALDLPAGETLVVHGDPITLTAQDLGRHTVLANANDVAAAGAEPRWLLTTVLLPVGTTPSETLALLGDIAEAAGECGVALVGGHTEVSDAVTRPVVSATMLGTVGRTELRVKSEARPGDRVVLTKGLAVEGTAVLAREMGERLAGLGMSAAELEDCRGLAAHLSVVPEARIAAGFAGVRAMHDVTEGGLATALRELTVATGCGIIVERERVPVLPSTARVCELLGADPLGLIGSGSLVVCSRPAETPALLAALRRGDVEAAVIGEVGAPGAGVSARLRGAPAPWPEFARDEAARLLEEQAGHQAGRSE